MRTTTLFHQTGIVAVITAIAVAAAALGSGALVATTVPTQSARNGNLPPQAKATLAAIKADELRGDLSFLASDTLQGRFTPSPGLDAAAEFIASRFRAAGLEPGGDHDYFQTAQMVDRRMPPPTNQITLREGTSISAIPPNSYTIYDTRQASVVRLAPVIVFPSRNSDALHGADVAGKAVLVKDIDFRALPRDKAQAEYMRMLAFDREIGRSGAAVEIIVSQGKLREGNSKLLFLHDTADHAVPVLSVRSEQLQEMLDRRDGSVGEGSISVDIPRPDDRTVTVKNVIGVLRGSDPQLKKTCVLLTAHYDHVGTTETAENSGMPPKASEAADHIYNGANDDGSGTVSVIEIAKAMGTTLRLHPKRSIVFMTFFGEERGELGSKFYGAHPVFPISQTVADINLEQVGRTDSTVGPQINSASLTGYDYSDVTKYLKTAGRLTGIKVYEDKEASDAYFTRSDNAALALQGVPAHSLTVAFDYPDYHSVGDSWQKIDYDNMARVDRMIALGLLNLANAPRAPQWNAENAKTAPFRAAQAKSKIP